MTHSSLGFLKFGLFSWFKKSQSILSKGNIEHISLPVNTLKSLFLSCFVFITFLGINEENYQRQEWPIIGMKTVQSRKAKAEEHWHSCLKWIPSQKLSYLKQETTQIKKITLFFLVLLLLKLTLKFNPSSRNLIPHSIKRSVRSKLSWLTFRGERKFTQNMSD